MPTERSTFFILILLIAATFLPSPTLANTEGFWKRRKTRIAVEEAERAVLLEKSIKRKNRQRILEKLADGFAARMKRRSGLYFWFIAAAGGGIILYICGRGGAGCDRDEELDAETSP